MSFPTKALKNLAMRVLKGEVIFFIGAGFSLDSEGNSAFRLITRLISRLEAMCIVLEKSDIIDDMFRTFSPSNTLSEDIKDINKAKKSKNILIPKTKHVIEYISSLSREYFSINEWFCKAFNNFKQSANIKITEETKRINMLENKILKMFNEIAASQNNNHKFDNTPIKPICKILLNLDTPFFGKALFLDSMGFNDSDIMGGEIEKNSYEEMVYSYRNRVRERHLVLARLAREGLCHQTTTTNYDLLLEGAYCMSGFELKDNGSSGTPSTRLNQFCTIAGAEDFFKHGHGYQTAIILKIHGCVRQYRKKHDMLNELKKYLPSMVFTYREIQNWREDAWSRDMLRTQIRTRTMVFCGYSGADPVLHDTFRSVYEEMQRRVPKQLKSLPVDPGMGPAFFTARKGSREFHGLELLTAASRSQGPCHVELGNHPNYLEFNLLNGAFPNLDEVFLWLFHIIFRKRQQEMLNNCLRSLYFNHSGRPIREDYFSQLVKAHEDLVKEEENIAETWMKSSDICNKKRKQLRRITAWTWFFQVGLLREWETGELMLRRTGPDQLVQIPKHAQWYVPTVYHPERTALGAVLEIALRRLINEGRKRESSLWITDSPWVFPLDHIHPTLSFVLDSNSPKGYQLGIRTAPPSARSLPSLATTNPFSQKTWILNTPHGKWLPNSSEVPNFKKLFDWAVGKFEHEDFENWLISKTK